MLFYKLPMPRNAATRQLAALTLEGSIILIQAAAAITLLAPAPLRHRVVARAA